MVLNNPYQTYVKQSVTTSKAEDLTLRLYQGIVKFIRLSKQAIQNKNFAESNQYNLRAQDILSELIVTLKKDTDISESLLAMYDYMKYRLIQANLHKRVEDLEEVEGYAVELAETWAAAMKQSRMASS